jgi:hypothetical protein
MHKRMRTAAPALGAGVKDGLALVGGPQLRRVELHLLVAALGALFLNLHHAPLLSEPQPAPPPHRGPLADRSSLGLFARLGSLHVQLHVRPQLGIRAGPAPRHGRRILIHYVARRPSGAAARTYTAPHADVPAHGWVNAHTEHATVAPALGRVSSVPHSSQKGGRAAAEAVGGSAAILMWPRCRTSTATPANDRCWSCPRCMRRRPRQRQTLAHVRGRLRAGRVYAAQPGGAGGAASTDRGGRPGGAAAVLGVCPRDPRSAAGGRYPRRRRRSGRPSARVVAAPTPREPSLLRSRAGARAGPDAALYAAHRHQRRRPAGGSRAWVRIPRLPTPPAELSMGSCGVGRCC